MKRTLHAHLQLAFGSLFTLFLTLLLAPGAIAEEPEVRGVITARSHATVSSQISARVTNLPFEAGQAFRKGDVLVGFDCAMHRAELRAAEAELGSARKTHANNRELAHLDAVGVLEVELSAAEVEKSQAGVELARVQTSRCQVLAPYAGRVVSTAVNLYESVQSNQELLRILDDSQLELELIVPSSWVRWLDTDTRFGFKVDETGETVIARVNRIGASVDPISQTVRLNAVFPERPGSLLAGMGGRASFETPASRATAGGGP